MATPAALWSIPFPSPLGLTVRFFPPSGGNIGIGFAIPSNMARTVAEQLVRAGSVQRGMLGVGVQSITPELAKALSLKDSRGVLINSVQPGSPAQKAGLRAGDVITALNGTPVDDPNALRNRIASTPPGTEVTLTFVRDGMSSKPESTWLHCRKAKKTPTPLRLEMDQAATTRSLGSLWNR